MDASVGRLYWRPALSSTQNIPDVSLSAQRAAEPDNVLWSWPRFPCLDWRWSIRNGIGWSGVSVISLVINSFRKLSQNKKLVRYCIQTNLVFAKRKWAFIKERFVLKFEENSWNVHLLKLLLVWSYEVLISEVFSAYAVSYPLEHRLKKPIPATCSNLSQTAMLSI